MPGQAEKINVVLLHIDGKDPGRLSAVHTKQQTLLPGQSAQAADGEADTEHIGSMGADNGLSIGRQSAAEVFHCRIVVSRHHMGHIVNRVPGRQRV